MKKEIKGFMCGLIVATVGITTVTAAVEQFILSKANYSVVINGVDYNDPESPLLNYNGRTYAPLRSMLEASGLYVDFIDGKAIVSKEPIQNNFQTSKNIIDNKVKTTKESLVGTWQGMYSVSGNEMKETPIKVTYTFLSDGTFTEELTIIEGMIIVYKGKYEIMDNTLKIIQETKDGKPYSGTMRTWTIYSSPDGKNLYTNEKGQDADYFNGYIKE